MDIIYQDPGGIGYHPVLHMVRLAVELFEADLFVYPKNQSPDLLQKLSFFLPSRQGKDCCLVICASPAELRALQLFPDWRKQYGQIVAWVFDSFWIEHISLIARGPIKHFDHIYVTEPEDIEQWQRITGISTSCLPWGTDALRLGSHNPDRPIDLLRLGRQPKEWDDDIRTMEFCRKNNIRFQGRPECYEDAARNQQHLMQVFAQTKFSLSWSNRVSPAIQTHPVREYITARWTDALAAGTTIAGMAPRTEVVDQLFWPGALLELSGVGLQEGIVEIKQAMDSWTPEQARNNAHFALERLDWRWRFKAIADLFDYTSSSLEKELLLLDELINRKNNPHVAID